MWPLLLRLETLRSRFVLFKIETERSVTLSHIRPMSWDEFRWDQIDGPIPLVDPFILKRYVAVVHTLLRLSDIIVPGRDPKSVRVKRERPKHTIYHQDDSALRRASSSHRGHSTCGKLRKSSYGRCTPYTICPMRRGPRVQDFAHIPQPQG